jgi:antitoxin component of RelBE/YafQ-DinJ toxin-antitoxin module
MPRVTRVPGRIHVTMSLDEKTLNSFQALCEKKGVSVSEAVRKLLKEEVTFDKYPHARSVPGGVA